MIHRLARGEFVVSDLAPSVDPVVVSKRRKVVLEWRPWLGLRRRLVFHPDALVPDGSAADPTLVYDPKRAGPGREPAAAELDTATFLARL